MPFLPVFLIICCGFTWVPSSAIPFSHDQLLSKRQTVSVSELEKRVDLLSKTFDIVSLELHTETGRINDLHTRMAALELQLQAEVTNNQHLNTRVATLEQQKAADVITIQHLEATINQTTDRVGFWAELTDQQHTPRVVNQPIVWPIVSLNIGNDYNSATGVFHCRVAGMYWIGVTVFAEKTEFMNANIYKNGSPISQADAYAENNAQSSAWIIADLKAGDTLYVASSNAKDRLFSKFKYSFFSGFKIA